MYRLVLVLCVGRQRLWQALQMSGAGLSVSARPLCVCVGQWTCSGMHFLRCVFVPNQPLLHSNGDLFWGCHYTQCPGPWDDQCEIHRSRWDGVWVGWGFISVAFPHVWGAVSLEVPGTSFDFPRGASLCRRPHSACGRSKQSLRMKARPMTFAAPP
jgi:hypothetical protein